MLSVALHYNETDDPLEYHIIYEIMEIAGCYSVRGMVGNNVYPMIISSLYNIAKC